LPTTGEKGGAEGSKTTPGVKRGGSGREGTEEKNVGEGHVELEEEDYGKGKCRRSHLLKATG